jgi:uncharacterized protein YjbI with pentapeptide repeats
VVGGNRQIARAFQDVDLSPDVQSLGGLAGALVSANLWELFVVVLTVTSTGYLVARPFASGYQTAYMLLGRPERLSPRHRGSALTRTARRLDIPAKEGLAAQAAGVTFRNEWPVDLLVKASILAPLVYIASALMRFVSLGSITFGGAGGLDYALALLALALIIPPRFGWLLRRALSRGYSPGWLVVPLLIICAIAIVAVEPSSPAQLAASERAEALEKVGLAHLPKYDDSALRLAFSLNRDLSRIDLRGADLQRAKLAGKLLVSVDFEYADLRGADMHGSDLEMADLRAADLRRANLNGADLRGANLSCAALHGADLRAVKLERADVRSAVYSHSTRWPRHVPRSHGLVPPSYGVSAEAFPGRHWSALACARGELPRGEP